MRALVLLLAAASVAPYFAATDARAQYYGRVRDDGPVIPSGTPAELQQIGVDEHLRAQVPLATSFRDHTGRRVRLSDLVNGEKPVLLNLAYHSCPQLCSMVQDAVVKSIAQIPWDAGDEYDVVTLSIDPRDRPQDAARVRSRILAKYDRPAAQRGWHFLVGDDASIRTVASAVGFRYFYDEAQGQYGHPAAIMLLTPSGVIARYLYGLEFAPNDVRIGLFEASEGRSIDTIEQLILYCYHYDPQGSEYVLIASRVMKIGGALTLGSLVSFIAVLWWRFERRRRHPSQVTAQG
jgi:protein SCO1/2